jgi:hypothetical protein
MPAHSKTKRPAHLKKIASSSSKKCFFKTLPTIKPKYKQIPKLRFQFITRKMRKDYFEPRAREIYKLQDQANSLEQMLDYLWDNNPYETTGMGPIFVVGPLRGAIRDIY